MSATAFTDDPLVQRYLYYLQNEKRYSPLTIEAYRGDLSLFGHWFQERAPQAVPGIPWLRAQTADVRAWVSALHRRGMSGKSLHRKLSAIRRFYQFLLRENLVQNNPCHLVHAPRSPLTLPDILSVEQASQLLSVNPEDALERRDLAMLELFYSSGLRLSELVALDVQALDLEQGLVRVMGKGSKQRDLPVGRMAVQALWAWLEIRPSFCDPSERALFVSQQQRRITTRNVQLRLNRWQEKYGLSQKVHPHKLRHSFASHMLESSGDLRAVQELLGHANIGTTQVYTHLDFQHLASVYDHSHPRARKKPTTDSEPEV